MREKEYAYALYKSAEGQPISVQEKRVDNLLKLLAHRGHTRLLPSIVRQFESLVRREKERRRIEVITDTKISAEEIKAIVARDECQDIRYFLEGEVVGSEDQTLIGGFKVKSRDILVDASYKTKLLELYKTLVR